MLSQKIKPRELSKDLINTLRSKNDSNLKMNGYLQVVDLKEDGSFMTLSDGFSYSEAALFKTVRPKIIDQDVKKFDILSVIVLLHKGTINVVVDFDKIYGGLSGPLGRPIDFSSYLGNGNSNPQGDHKIPKSYWNTSDKPDAPRPQQAKAMASRGLMEEEECTPIQQLTPGSTSWLIKARVTKKGAKREFNSSKGGKGSVFSCVLIDNSGQIQATFFSDAAEKYYNYLIENNVYFFSLGEIKKSGPYNQTGNPIEIVFSMKSDISQCEDDGKIDNVKFNFIKIGDIPNKDVKTSGDVICIITEVGEVTDLPLKAGDSKKKQSLKIKDDTNFSVDVNVWGDLTAHELFKVGATVIITDVTVGDYRGKNLSTKAGTKILTNFPDLPRVRELISWRNNLSKSTEFGVLQDTARPLPSTSSAKSMKAKLLVTVIHFKKISDDVLLNESDKKEFYTMVAVVTGFSPSFYYDKCPNENCFKKVNLQEDNQHVSECPTCGIIQKPPIPRYIGNVKVTDHTGSIYLNYSNDNVATVLFNKAAQELKEMQQLGRDEILAHFKKRTNIAYTFRVYAKKEIFNGEVKVKHHISSVYDLEGTRLRSANVSLQKTLNKYKEMLTTANS